MKLTSQDKKKILLQFAEIDNHINELQVELNMWWTKATAISPVISDMPRGGSADGTKIERAIEHITKIEQQIDDEIDKLLILRNDLIKAINKLSDIRERRVLYLAYIGKTDGDRYKRLKLWQIAKEMNYSESYIEKLHCYALLHLNLENCAS